MSERPLYIQEMLAAMIDGVFTEEIEGYITQLEAENAKLKEAIGAWKKEEELWRGCTGS